MNAASSTSAAHINKKRKEKAPIVETEVRRSCRLQQINRGFKRQTCQDRNCFPCNAGPPTIASKIVKNLYVSFCKANAKDCSEEMLQQPKKKKENKSGAQGAINEDQGAKAGAQGVKKKDGGAKPQ